jgi:hypothetical protein
MTEAPELHNAGALTKGERRAVWAAAAAGLLTLAALFFAGLFTGLRADNPFLPGFYWIANVIAAVSSGILASTISGFLTVQFEKQIGRRGRVLIQGTGGFAVFLLVMWANPQNQMFKLADSVFASLMSDCEKVGDGAARSNVRESCEQLISRYPLRPEPYGLLARWTHINRRDEYDEAARLYRRAVELYGVRSPITRSSGMSLKTLPLLPAQWIRLSQDLSGFSFAQGDHLLTAYSRGQMSAAELAAGLDEIVEASYLLSDHVLSEKSDLDIWARVFDVRGKIALYRYFVDGRKDVGHLRRAVAAYEDAISREKDFPLMLQYHKFVTLVLLRSMEMPEGEAAGETLSQMLHGWAAYFDAKWVQSERSHLKETLTQVLENRRAEPWRVTRVFGSVELGGTEMQAFFNSQKVLTEQLRQRVNEL